MKTRTPLPNRQHGNIAIGLIVGLVLGLGVALGVAVYVTKVPIPFANKVPSGGADQDQAEALRNKDWDPNAPLAGKRTPAPAPAPVTPAPAASTPAPAVVGASGSDSDVASAPSSFAPLPNAPVPIVITTPASRASRPQALPPPSSDPIGDIARAKSGIGNDPFIYFVQAGAFRSTDDAQAQRAKLSLMGVESRITEREQAGRTVFRVRAGPFASRDVADELNDRLKRSGMDVALVRVQR